MSGKTSDAKRPRTRCLFWIGLGKDLNNAITPHWTDNCRTVKMLVLWDFRRLSNTSILNTVPSTQTIGYDAFTRSPTIPFATLGYGYEVAGYPHFEVSEIEGEVQIEVKHSEQFAGLNSVYSDGPYLYNVGLANSYRVETFAVNFTGLFTPLLLQGGLKVAVCQASYFR
ncbi:hypothetical protein DL98DRAFT_571306 [Cadophora sp. DSE1049]|nr:hypothetical protein DL98DRAFT_571306 [Cadophora sp. DSE1049]